MGNLAVSINKSLSKDEVRGLLASGLLDCLGDLLQSCCACGRFRNDGRCLTLCSQLLTDFLSLGNVDFALLLPF